MAVLAFIAFIKNMLQSKPHTMCHFVFFFLNGTVYGETSMRDDPFKRAKDWADKGRGATIQYSLIIHT